MKPLSHIAADHRGARGVQPVTVAQAPVFEVFPSGARSWCARRADGLVCGFFVNRAAALLFVRRETCGRGVVNIQDGAAAPSTLRRAA